MDALREPMQAHVDDFETRRDRWYQLVDSDILKLLRNDRHAEARARIRSIVGPDVAAVLDTEMDDFSEAVPATA